jgi:hypothetical protein
MPHPALVPLTVAAALAGMALGAQAQVCSARTGAQAATVVELYTSEGCNSCPPADRWLSALPAGTAVVPLAFHVDYWDHLGWRDRFASPAHTQRQAQQRSVNGARYSYTPQVVVNGADRKDWPSLRLSASAAPLLEITLMREGERVQAQVRAPAEARLAAYWAVTEMGHRTAVGAGENQGETLKHDHVVRELQPVPAWTAGAGGATRLQFTPARPADPAHPRRVNLVVVDAGTGRPVQALSLDC